MRKALLIPEQLCDRAKKYLAFNGSNFTELVKRALDEFLKKEGF